MSGTRWIAILVVAVTLAGVAQTAKRNLRSKTVLWSPPDIGIPKSLPAPNVPNEMITRLSVAGMPVILETTKLKDAQKRFSGTIGSEGDASTALAWLCFHGGNAPDRWMLWITSSELGGGIYIDGVQWRQLSPNEVPDRRCPALPAGGDAISLPLALHPGMTRAQVVKTLGRPTLETPRLLCYLHEHYETINELSFTADDSVWIILRGDVVREIDFGKDTVN